MCDCKCVKAACIFIIIQYDLPVLSSHAISSDHFFSDKSCIICIIPCGAANMISFGAFTFQAQCINGFCVLCVCRLIMCVELKYFGTDIMLCTCFHGSCKINPIDRLTFLFNFQFIYVSVADSEIYSRMHIVCVVMS